MVTAKKTTAKKTAEPKLKVAARVKSPKELATKKKEPYVAVVGVELEEDNPGNGAFELDWNEYFVLQLRQAGYGFDGDADETVVDMWFKSLARNMLSDEGLETNRSQGFINVQKLDKNRSEIG